MLTFEEMMEADIHPSGYVLRCMVCKYLTSRGNCSKIGGFFRSIPLYICDKANQENYKELITDQRILMVDEELYNAILNSEAPDHTKLAKEVKAQEELILKKRKAKAKTERGDKHVK